MRSYLLIVVAGAVVGALGCAGGGPSPERSLVSPVLSRDGKALGAVALPTSCTPDAQEHLERGLALLHHMTYLHAEESFRTAAEADGDCAIAYWGQAMTFVHPLWPDVVPEEKLTRGRKLLERAASAAHTSDRERGYVDALAAYYDGGPAERDRLVAFRDGWKRAADAFPDDLEAALFHALAQLGVGSPPGMDSARESAGAIAERVLARIPDHPGAHHYVIHAYDFPPLAARALDTARSYDDVAPENSHALHMTSHIFTRLGMWPESIEFNERAADAAREPTPTGAVSMHHLHAVDYLAYAHLQRGDHDAAKRTLEELEALEPPYQNHAATAYAFAAVPARYALERHEWSEAAKVEPRWPSDVAWDQYPHLEAIPVFARAIGAARTGSVDEARTALDSLSQLQIQAAEMPSAYDWGIQVAIQAKAAGAWLAYESGDEVQALQAMKEAAEMEASTEKNPVTPGEALPAMELYADMLLAERRYDAAKTQYEATLARSPNRLNSLFGAGRAAELSGDADAAAAYYETLIASVVAHSDRPEVDHAREFIASRAQTSD